MEAIRKFRKLILIRLAILLFQFAEWCGVTAEQQRRWAAIREARAAAKKQKSPKKPASQPAANCPHRGDVARLQLCHGCQGAVQIKVFACSQHGECTIGKQLPGVHLCRWPKEC